jgi:hypothetical protein
MQKDNLHYLSEELRQLEQQEKCERQIDNKTKVLEICLKIVK